MSGEAECSGAGRALLTVVAFGASVAVLQAIQVGQVGEGSCWTRVLRLEGRTQWTVVTGGTSQRVVVYTACWGRTCNLGEDEEVVLSRRKASRMYKQCCKVYLRLMKS